MERALTTTVDDVVGSAAPRARSAYIDNLKVVLVAGVIVGHTTIAWTGVGNWVFDEPHLGEPLLSLATLLLLIGGMFGMAMFFLIAGIYTAPSLARKGPGRFLIDRAIRLGIPMLFFIVALSPIVEYVDPENAGWDQGFGAFALDIWWPPAPGPTWFLGVLLFFSTVYAAVRTIRPGRNHDTPLRVRHLLVAAVVVTLASYAVRLAVPLGEEVWRLGLAQAPAWIVGFTLGVLGGERGWFTPVPPRLVVVARWSALAAIAALLILVVTMGADLESFSGGGTWQSFLAAGLEGLLVVSMPLWLLDVFRRHFDHQGRVAREMSRAAFAAFVLHQVILVGLVLASRFISWAPEVEYVIVSVLGVSVSFYLGWLVVRLPGVRRVV